MNLRGKKVLLTTSHRNIGSGGSIQMLLLAESLVKAGAVVHAAFNYRDGARLADSNLDRMADLGVPIRFFRMNRWYSPVQIFRLRRLLVRERYDIIHTHKGGDLSLVLLASLGQRVPVIVNTRGVNFPLGANRVKYWSRRLDRVIVVSRDSKDVMVRCGVAEAKVRVVYGGVDTTRFRPRPEKRGEVRASLGIGDDAIVSMMVANLVRQKGHGDYLQAAALLKQSHPEAHHLFAGKGDQTQWREEAERLGVADRVHFLGFRKDVADLYAACDFSVVASFAGEGVSGVLRESMACRVPVITTDVGGNAELVRDGETGLVAPINDPPALAEAMRRMIEDRAFHDAATEAGYRDVIDRHGADARAKRVFAVYKEVMREKGLID